MKVKELKAKIDELIASGKITEDTEVVGASDEFDVFYPISSDAKLLVDLEHEIADLDSSIEYAEKTKKDTYLKSLLEKKAKYEKLGSVVVCVC